MSPRRRRVGGASLDERLVALGEATATADGVVPAPDLDAARAVVARAGERLGHGVDRTVVALAGATGSGKSSLFNALVGEDLSAVGVRRPTTSTTSAAAWGDGAGLLLDWLAVPRRHVVEVGDGGPGGAAGAHAAGGGAAGAGRRGDEALDGLVLLDLPDHDSTAVAHRAEVDRVVAMADVVVWVLDPQKYADAAVHERYLRPLAGHAGVLLVVLNQADRLDAAALAACLADLERLLQDDGLRHVPVVATSATTGAGLPALRTLLVERVQARRSAVDRLAADVDAAVARLAPHCGPRAGDAAAPAGGGLGRRTTAEVVDAVAVAAGVPTVVDAVARSHRSAAVAATGWPATRWVRRLRPDPLRRLHLGTGGGSAARTSLPPASAVSRSRLSTAVRRATDEAAGGLPEAWADAVRAASIGQVDEVGPRLDAAVAGTDLGTAVRPRWWSVVGAVQGLLAVLALVGGVWLAGLAVLGALQLGELGDLGTPDLGAVPWPTALLLGGVVLGLALAGASRVLAGVGARRRARRAEARLRASVREVAEASLLRPVAGVLERRARFCAALDRAAGGRRRP